MNKNIKKYELILQEKTYYIQKTEKEVNDNKKKSDNLEQKISSFIYNVVLDTEKQQLLNASNHFFAETCTAKNSLIELNNNLQELANDLSKLKKIRLDIITEKNEMLVYIKQLKHELQTLKTDV